MSNKIKNNKSTLVLLFGGIVGKLVGFILRIIVTRKLGPEGMGLYSLLAPTSALLSVIATLSYPTALSKIISEKSSRTKTLFASIIPLSLIINIFIIIVTMLIIERCFSTFYVFQSTSSIYKFQF